MCVCPKCGGGFAERDVLAVNHFWFVLLNNFMLDSLYSVDTLQTSGKNMNKMMREEDGDGGQEEERDEDDE